MTVRSYQRAQFQALANLTPGAAKGAANKESKRPSANENGPWRDGQSLGRSGPSTFGASANLGLFSAIANNGDSSNPLSPDGFASGGIGTQDVSPDRPDGGQTTINDVSQLGEAVKLFEEQGFTEANGHPTALILDTDSRSYDIDGDGLKDANHAEVVTRIFQGNAPNANAITFVQPDNLVVNDLERLKQINEFVDQYQAENDGKLPFHGLNYSIEQPYTMTPERVGRETLDQADVPGVRESLTQWAEDNADHESFGPWGQEYLNWIGIGEQLDALREKGIEVTVNSGNFGPEGFNFATMTEHTTNVASKNADGDYYPQASRTDLVDAEQTVYSPAIVPGGYDLTGDDRPEFTNEEVTGGARRYLLIEGRNVNDPGRTTSDVSAVAARLTGAQAPRGQLISVAEGGAMALAEAFDWDEQKTNAFIEYGEKRNLYMMDDASMFFTADENGTLALDPDASRDDGRRVVSDLL
ncbi:MAG: hypothetical protein AAFV29_08645, partial [Myxococcota bacterium]